MFRIIAVLIEDDPRVIEAIAPHVLATSDLPAFEKANGDVVYTYKREVDAIGALLNLEDHLRETWLGR